MGIRRASVSASVMIISAELGPASATRSITTASRTDPLGTNMLWRVSSTTGASVNGSSLPEPSQRCASMMLPMVGSTWSMTLRMASSFSKEIP